MRTPTTPAPRLLARGLGGVEARPVDRPLHEGDGVGGFEVLEVPGHSPGALAFWRSADRVLFTGDVFVNVHPVTDPGLFATAVGHALR